MIKSSENQLIDLYCHGFGLESPWISRSPSGGWPRGIPRIHGDSLDRRVSRIWSKANSARVWTVLPVVKRV